jgi:hypothetical protein
MIAALGAGTLFLGYALGLWGYCLLRGYCITLRDIFNWNYPSSVSGSAASGG